MQKKKKQPLHDVHKYRCAHLDVFNAAAMNDFATKNCACNLLIPQI